MKNHALWLSASVLALGWCGVAGAQTPSTTPSSPGTSSSDSTTSDEIVVTAERRSTDLQRTPIAASVLSGEDLANKGVSTVDALQFATPGATIDNFGQGIDFNIRGIGKGEHNSQTTVGVITYRDGVATFPGYFQEEPYYDIASVEILRGPQGTFGGQNSTGGAVFVNTNNPIINGGYHGYAAGQLGNYSDLAAQGALNVPLGDTLAARVSFNGERRDSFYTFHGPGGTHYAGNPGDLRMYSGRLGLLWKPNSSLSVLWKTDVNYLDLGAYPADPFNATNDPFHLTANAPQLALDRFVRTSVKIDYVLPNGITLRSVSGYQQGNTSYRADLDGTASGNLTFADSANEILWSQELNIISPDTGFMTWILGAYADYDKYSFPRTFKFIIGEPPGSLASEYLLQGENRVPALAAFGQASFNLTSRLQLQVGGRYTATRTSNDVQILQFGAFLADEQTEKFSNFSGKISLDWALDPHNFFYGFISTGFRPGGLNVPVGLGTPAAFREEKVREFEVGWKNIAFNGHMHTQLDAYHTDYDNFQVTVGYPAIPVFGFELNNPNTTTIYGFEAQTEAVFGPLSFDVGVAWMRSSLGKFFATDPRIVAFAPCNPATGPASASCINLTGHDQTYAPNFTFNVGAEYQFSLGGGDTLTPRVNFGHVSQQWATLFEKPALGDHLAARNIASAQLAWTHGDIVATLYSTNVTDQHYVGALNSGLRFEGPPRQYGIRIMKAF